MSKASIRRHMLLVEMYNLKQKILESQNYEGMFTDLQKQINQPNYPNSSQQQTILNQRIKEVIEWSKKVLKKNDRIVWFLRFARYGIATAVGVDKNDALKYLNSRAKTNYTATDIMPYRQLMNQLQHYMGISSPKIQNFVFAKQIPSEILKLFEKYENEWKSSANDDAGAEEMFKNNRLIPQYDNDDIILKFPDGFVWIDLHAPVDEEEGEAMGHCGNRGSYKRNETILSLRKPVNYQHEKWWYPVCTFILDGTGRLGEMKGRNNDKPQAKYHPYIMALLKRTDLIKGIKGGGYMPQNNFSLADLTSAQRESVTAVNDNLYDIPTSYELRGITDELKKQILGWVDDNDIVNHGQGGLSMSWITNYKKMESLVLEEFEDLGELIEKIGNSTAKWIMNVLHGDEFIDVSGTPESSTSLDIINSIKPESLKKLGNYLKDNYPDETEEFNQDNDIDFDPSNAHDVFELYELTEDYEIENALLQAYSTGLEIGTENEMMKYFDRAVNDILFNIVFFENGKNIDTWKWDTKCFLVIPIAELVSMMKEFGSEDELADQLEDQGWYDLLEVKLDVDQPSYGFNDYEQKAAYERFEEEINEFV
jgi:hypothetical protein